MLVLHKLEVKSKGKDREQSKERLYLYLASFGILGHCPHPMPPCMIARCIRNRSEDNDRLISAAPTFESIGDRATRRNRLLADAEDAIMISVSLPRTLAV